MKTVAIVPVRGGSKGLPGKNTALLAGVPLWERAVAQGKAAGADEVVVSTDMEALHARVPQVGARLVERPDELARDDTPMAPVILHALQSIDGAARIILLQATSPLRSAEDVAQSIDLHASGAFDLVMTVTETSRGILKYGTMDGDRFVPVSDPALCFTNRQSLPEVMRPNGAVYVFDKTWFIGNGGFESDRIGGVVMPETRSQDIDTAEDLERAERLLAER